MFLRKQPLELEVYRPPYRMQMHSLVLIFLGPMVRRLLVLHQAGKKYELERHPQLPPSTSYTIVLLIL